MEEEEDKVVPVVPDGAKRLSDIEFEEARDLYERGRMGLGEIADKFNVSRQALSKRFKNAGVVRGSRVKEEVKAANQAFQAVVERFAERRADWIEETRLEGVKTLKQIQLIARKTVLDQIKAQKPLGEIDDDLKAIQRFNKIIIDNVEASLGVLRANEHIDEDDLPILGIEDLTNEDILEHHKRSGAVPEGMTVEEMLAEEIDIGDL